MNYPLVTPSKESAHAANVIAAVLSLVIPGSGQIYKGQFTSGLVWMFVGIPLAIWVGILLSLATAGLGLILPVLCWVGQAVGAYFVVDLRRRRHHHLAEPTIYDDYD